MISLLGKIWLSISSTPLKEKEYPKKEELRIREKDNHFFVQHKTKCLWIFNCWEYLCYNDTGSKNNPISFNKFEEAIKFINEISCD